MELHKPLMLYESVVVAMLMLTVYWNKYLYCLQASAQSRALNSHAYR